MVFECNLQSTDEKPYMQKEPFAPFVKGWNNTLPCVLEIMISNGPSKQLSMVTITLHRDVIHHLPMEMYKINSEVITTPSLMDQMEVILCTPRENQYSTNVSKRVIGKEPKFKRGDLVRYLLRREQFSKESNLSGSWTTEIYQVHHVHKAHSFKPMHTYTLSELNTNTPIKGLPTLPEYQLKKATITRHQLFPIERVLKRRKNKVLVKWQGYDVPTWEPKRALTTTQ